MAVNLVFNAVLARISRFREQANDLEELASGVLLAPVRRKPDRLADRAGWGPVAPDAVISEGARPLVPGLGGPKIGCPTRLRLHSALMFGDPRLGVGFGSELADRGWVGVRDIDFDPE
jgi:hypothetical protein